MNKQPCYRALLSISIIIVAAIVATTLFGCAANEEQDQKSLSLSEYLEETNENWFLTGKKEYTVQAMMVSKEMTFHNDLEVVDLVAADDGETVVLKGTRDEIWTSPLSQVIARYTKPDGSELSKEDFANKDVYIDIVTIPTRDAYYAMHVPKDITVIVETAQGDILHTNLPNASHGEGDYLICTIGEDGGPNLSDVWVLNGLIFPDCYDTSHLNEQEDFDIHAELENPAIPKMKEDVIHLAFVGDSVTFGNGVWIAEKSKKHTYPAYIERMMGDGYQALNYGVSGKTLLKEGDNPYTSHYMYDESINANAETYVIMLGSNDSKPQNWNTGDFRSELKDFVQTYIDLESHPTVYLATPPRAFEEAEEAFGLNNDTIENEIASIVREVAEELDITMIDMYEKTKDHPEWFMDGSHPNASGNKEFAKIIVSYLTDEY